MRFFDFFYFLYFAYILRLFFPHSAFSRIQKGFLTLTLALFAVALARTGDIAILVRAFRETACPIAFLIAGAIAASDENLAAILARNRLPKILVLILLVSITVGITQMLTVEALSDYWFFDYMTKNKIEIAETYNFIRNGHSRGTGLGFSPFSLGYFGLGLGIFGLVLLIIEDRFHFRSRLIWRVLPIVSGLIACFLSDSRLAAVSLGGLILLWWSRLSPKFLTIASILIVYLFGITFVNYLQDPSFNARFLQWGLRIEDGTIFNLFGSTMASGPKEGWADSFILNFINNFGILALATYLVFVLSFARGYMRRVTVFSLTTLIIVHTTIQALEYNVFLPLAFMSLGLLCGLNRNLPIKYTRSGAIA